MQTELKHQRKDHYDRSLKVRIGERHREIIIRSYHH